MSLFQRDTRAAARTRTLWHADVHVSDASVCARKAERELTKAQHATASALESLETVGGREGEVRLLRLMLAWAAVLVDSAHDLARMADRLEARL